MAVLITGEALVEEQQAIRRLKRGDIRGLAVLVNRYQSQAIRTAYLITHDVAMAEDVVQDVFLQVYQSIDHFDASRPFRPWFMRAVVNAAVRAARHDQRRLSLEAAARTDYESDISFEDLLPDPGPGPEARMEQEDLEQAVEAALTQLPPEQRAAIVLRYYLDFEDDEISEQLDCAPGTVRWRLHAARKQLGVLLRRLAVDRPATS
jgi:RNA polymerase sigma-70 factor (ECF subfamily)